MSATPQLITYPDRLAADLPSLRALLDGALSGVFAAAMLSRVASRAVKNLDDVFVAD